MLRPYTATYRDLIQLERETQTEARHERIESVEREFVVGSEGGDFSDNCLRISDVEEVHGRNQVVALVEAEVSSEAEVEQVDARQAVDACGLENDSLADDIAFAVRHPKGLRRLQGEARVMLEVDARSQLPREFIAAVQLENVGGIAVQVVVFAIDVQVGIIEVVREGVVRESAAEQTFLAL